MKTLKYTVTVVIGILVSSCAKHQTEPIRGVGNAPRLTMENEAKIATEVHDRVNKYRKELDKGELQRLKELDRLAYQHSKRMFQDGQTTHKDFHIRSYLIKKHLGSAFCGENVSGGDVAFLGKDTAGMMVKNWIHSKGHRQNIESNAYNATGIGVYIKDNDIYATQLFMADPSLKK